MPSVAHGVRAYRSSDCCPVKIALTVLSIFVRPSCSHSWLMYPVTAFVTKLGSQLRSDLMLKIDLWPKRISGQAYVAKGCEI